MSQVFSDAMPQSNAAASCSVLMALGALAPALDQELRDRLAGELCGLAQ
jgi:hypothetical protein